MQCKKLKPNGGRCQARAQLDSEFCFSHDPALCKERREAQRKGGLASRSERARSLGALVAGKFDFSSPEKILPALAAVANMLFADTLDAKTGHAICHAADTALRAIELGTTKAQLDRLERQLALSNKRPVDPAEIQDILRFERSEVVETLEQLERRSNDAGRRLE